MSVEKPYIIIQSKEKPIITNVRIQVLDPCFFDLVKIRFEEVKSCEGEDNNG